MIFAESKFLSLEQIAISGQCFRMERVGNGNYSLIALDKYVKVIQTENGVCFDCSEVEYNGFWKNYFDLDTDYGLYIDSIDKNDKFLSCCAKKSSGIRILNQDPWEMLVTFLISQRNNIKRIKKCISRLCIAYGKSRTLSDGTVYYSFPQAEDIAFKNPGLITECGLGYRSRYIINAAKQVAENSFNISALLEMSYDVAKEQLLTLLGVGEKVADCICLFGLHKMDAFPVDTHIKKVLAAHYPNGFPFEKYKGFAGLLQQYMFYYDLYGYKS